MRMWMVDTKIMCRKHLLGEHVELHMFVGTMRNGTSVNGYVTKGRLEIASLKTRHADLVKEMLSRGYKHNSPLKDYPAVYWQEHHDIFINKGKSLKDLITRCPECYKNHYDLIKKQYEEMKQLALKYNITIVGCNYKTRRVKNEI